MAAASRGLRSLFLGLAGLVLVACACEAAEIRVLISGGYTAAFKELAPIFEQASGTKVDIVPGPSMGDTPNAIPTRLARGEPADVLIMVGYALDKLNAEGKVKPGSAAALARSPIGVAVKAGAPVPDISTLEAFKKALLDAKSVAYSDSASGVYVSTEMFQKMGIADAMKGKARMIPADPVAGIVARGDAELGLQQVAELLPVPGITFVGKIPQEVQKITIYATGVVATSKEPVAAQALIDFLRSPKAADAVTKSGLEPIIGK